MEKQVVASRIQTPDGTVLWSRYVHDCVFYKDTKTNEMYMLDGGTDYMRISGKDYKDVSIYSNARWKTLRQYVIRNTMLLDKNKQPTGETGFVRICDMSDQHLVDLKNYILERAGTVKLVIYIEKEQAYRKKNNVSIPEHDYREQLVDCIETKKKRR